MKRPSECVLLAVLLIACVHTAAAQELLVNGGFETGDLSGWTFIPTASAEPTIAGSVAPFMGSNALRVNTGSNLSGVEGGATLSQTVALVAGQAYQVSAGMLAIASVNGSPNADGGTISLSLGGVLLHTFDVGMLAADEVQTDAYSAPFIAAATGPAQFELLLTRQFPNFAVTPGVYHYADGLSVVRVVPEPCAWVLGAVVGMVLVGNRRGWI